MEILLRIAAGCSAAWAIGLAFPGLLPGHFGPFVPDMRSMASGLASANIALAFMFYRASSNPPAHRPVLYAALMLFGLRGLLGTYEVLYVLEGPPAVLRLADMVLSLALFVGLLNSLPATLQRDRSSQAGRP